MYPLRRGVAPRGWGLLLAVLGPVAVAAFVAGCATSSAETTAASPTLVRADRDAKEDDGLPAQVAPPIRIRQLPDDPREPFSPNYGPQPPVLPLAKPSRMSQAEEDAVIARAITAHEMRRP